MRDALGVPALACVLAALACGGGETLDVPTTGTLVVTTSTTGVEPDADGYSIQIDDGPLEPIGTGATYEKTGLAAGSHTVRLEGVAANCTVTGQNPRSVTLSAGEQRLAGRLSSPEFHSPT